MSKDDRVEVTDSPDVLLLRAMLCLSGLAGEGICVTGFDDPADLYCEIAQALSMGDADDADLRRHIEVERHRLAATPPSPPAMVEVATQAMREAGTAVKVADGRGNYTALNWEEAAEVWSVMYLAASLRPQAG
jgi:hypothetical protein